MVPTSRLLLFAVVVVAGWGVSASAQTGGEPPTDASTLR